MLLKIAAIAAIVYLDQLTKWLITTYLPEDGIIIINGVLRFTYVENTGAAFGMLSDYRWVFISLSSIAILGMLWYLFFKKPESRLLNLSLVLLAGGGIGNMIDRVLLGYVVDFIDFYAFPKIWFWVFNIADVCITIGTALLSLYLITSTIAETKAGKVTAGSQKTESDIAAAAHKPQKPDKDNENPEADSSPS
ncbi:MAG: signal peptidase II [Eubacteriales bacterium]|jgi:signal peptidase II